MGSRGFNATARLAPYAGVPVRDWVVMSATQKTSFTPRYAGHRRRKAKRVTTYIGLVTCIVVLLVAALKFAHFMPSAPTGSAGSPSTGVVSYLGVDEPDAPGSYADMNHFAQAIGRQPNIAMYYSSSLEKFQVAFATSAAKRGAVTLVQIGTGNTSLASIADGRYDSYWRSYADHVKAFGTRVILSLDHEMNGSWYPWGYQHTSPEAFVAAWRHIVTIFREQGTRNVTWLWTVNVTDALDNHIADPDHWWPGSSYVDWVGIDGYYYNPSETFASLFGPTIADVRELTRDPVIIAETGATLSAGQPGKIADLFSGVRRFGLLGFVLFDQNGVYQYVQTWRINSPAAYAALRQGAEMYMKPPS
jgi:mannan endo-1,4-beta-mannosidase